MITIKTKPIGVNRLYQGRRFLTKLAKETKEAMAWEVKTQWKEGVIKTEITALDIRFYFKDRRGLDIDGALKGLLDCMSGIIWKDDRQIQRITAEKFVDKSNPRIELEVYY